MKVTYFHRYPSPRSFSMERLFAAVRSKLPPHVEAKVWVCPKQGTGLLDRLFNAVSAACHQGRINHVTGDVHYLAILMRKNRTILTIHDCVSLHRLTGIRRAVFKFWWYTLPIKRSALVTVISDFTKSEIITLVGCREDAIRVIHNPVADELQPAPSEFNAGRPRILQIGTSPNKNLRRSAVALKGIPCHLRIIGDLSPADAYLLLENSIDYSFEPCVSDTGMSQEFRDCDMVLFPSTYEGFGLPIIEGQATGRAVLTSNICSMPEVAGGAACLVDPFDVQSIREGILTLINDRAYRDTLIARGFCNVARFNPAAIARKFTDVYQELYSEQ